jgi:hypothetical protein
MNFTYDNHWKCLKDWLEFTLFKIILDRDKEYWYLEITILNFEVIWYIDYNKRRNNV